MAAEESRSSSIKLLNFSSLDTVVEKSAVYGNGIWPFSGNLGVYEDVCLFGPSVLLNPAVELCHTLLRHTCFTDLKSRHHIPCGRLKRHIIILCLWPTDVTFCLSSFVDSSDWPFSVLATEVNIGPTVSPESRPCFFSWSTTFPSNDPRPAPESESVGVSLTWKIEPSIFIWMKEKLLFVDKEANSPFYRILTNLCSYTGVCFKVAKFCSCRDYQAVVGRALSNREEHRRHFPFATAAQMLPWTFLNT